MPPCAAPEYRRQVEGLFRLLPAAQPASEALLPRQDPATGGAATRPPFRPDRSLDLALSRAAASLRLRQQAALGAGGAAAPPGVASPPGSGRGEGPGSAQPGSARTPGGVHHTRHGSAGAGAGGRLVRGLSAVKDSLAEAGSWLWNGRDHGECCQGCWAGGLTRGAAAAATSQRRRGQLWPPTTCAGHACAGHALAAHAQAAQSRSPDMYPCSPASHAVAQRSQRSRCSHTTGGGARRRPMPATRPPTARAPQQLTAA